MTPLQTRVAREIVAKARRDNLRAGERLAESVLADELGVSRTPVNVALKHLSQRGIVTYDSNRGYFLERDAEDCLDAVGDLFSEPDEPLYLRIAEDRLGHRLPDEVSEAELLRRYGVPRTAMRSVLSRIQEEGWAEKQLGSGWKFLPMIDTPEAYEESYAFRVALEPSGLLSATLNVNQAELNTLLKRQHFIAETGFETMTSIELFEANREFHETLAVWSGNRFILQSIKRVDSLRRLIEYRQASKRPPRRDAAREHIAILEALARRDPITAARLLREHLETARRSKALDKMMFSCDGS